MNAKTGINTKKYQQLLWLALIKHPIPTRFDTFFTTRTTFAILDNDVFVP